MNDSHHDGLRRLTETIKEESLDFLFLSFTLYVPSGEKGQPGNRIDGYDVDTRKAKAIVDCLKDDVPSPEEPCVYVSLGKTRQSEDPYVSYDYDYLIFSVEEDALSTLMSLLSDDYVK